MALYQDHVITLKARPYRDADVLVTVFGLKTGKITAIAKGVRRPRSPLAGQINPLTYSVISLYHGRSTLDTVTEAELLQGFPRIAEELDRLGWAMVTGDVVDQLWPERDPSPETFSVLLTGLDALNEGKKPATVGLSAGFHFLQIAGFGPDWDICSRCHQLLRQGPIHIDIEHSATLCLSCAPKTPGTYFPISLGSLRSLQYWLKQHPKKFGQAEVQGAMKEELQRLFFRYLLQQTGKPLKSHEFLMNIDRLKMGLEGEESR